MKSGKMPAVHKVFLGELKGDQSPKSPLTRVCRYWQGPQGSAEGRGATNAGWEPAPLKTEGLAGMAGRAL